MSSTQSRGRNRAKIVAIGLVAAAIIAYVIFSLGHYDRKPAAVADLNPTQTPTTSTLSAPPTPSATPTTTPTAMSSGFTMPGGVGFGLNGNSFNGKSDPHTVTLRAWSSKPIPALGYVVPTANDGGIVKYYKTASWTHTVTAYGPPKYAQLYVVTDSTGGQVNCEVIVDGRVTTSAHTGGPFTGAMCIG